MPVNDRTSYEFPARTLALAALLDGALIGRAEANGLQALLEEALAIAEETASFARAMDERADALVEIVKCLRPADAATARARASSRLWKRTEEMLLGEGDSLERPEERARGTTS
jgi:hypothetical protein